jgi:hypothetical protein
VIVAFWSPVPGQGKVTSSMVAIATSIGFEDRIAGTKTLVTTTKLGDDSLDRSYPNVVRSTSSAEILSGMGAIEQNLSAGKLTPATFMNNTECVLNDYALDKLSLNNVSNRETLEKNFPKMLEVASEAYDLCMVDIGSGEPDFLAKHVLSKAGLVVVCVPQNLRTVGKVKAASKEILGNKKVLYCIGAFERNAVCSPLKLATELDISPKDIGMVPYNVEYLDALNKFDALDFIARRVPVKKFLVFDEYQYFREQVSAFIKKILAKRTNVG